MAMTMWFSSAISRFRRTASITWCLSSAWRMSPITRPRPASLGFPSSRNFVDVYAKRLQTQEALTAQIVGAIDRHLRPRGSAVMLEAQHLCMSMRGVRKHGAETVTTQFTGVFRDDPAEQIRFLTMLRGGK